MYPVTLPAYQSCSSLPLLAETAYLYTANDVRLILFKGGMTHRPLSYLLWAQYTLSGGRLRAGLDSKCIRYFDILSFAQDGIRTHAYHHTFHPNILR